jgi:hypothetical protein
MINSVLSFVEKSLNEYIRMRFDLNEDKVIIGNLTTQEGTLAIKDQNKIVLSLVNIQEERMLKGSGKVFSKGSMGESGFSNPPIHLNLYLLFTSYFEQQLFNEGLKFLSLVIGFFQAQNVFNSVDFTEFSFDIEKLVFELENLSFQEQNNLWGSLGCKYIPSVLYKVRMISITENVIQQVGEVIREQNR